MSLKEELEVLARECIVCGKQYVSHGESSLNECPSCHEYYMKSELAEIMTDTVQVLAGMTDSERFDILRTRFRSFVEMDPELMKREFTDMLDAMAELEKTQRTVIEKTISKVLKSLPEGESRVLMDTLDSIVKGWNGTDNKAGSRTNKNKKSKKIKKVKKKQ